jgi:hypothetical protein
MEIFKFNVKYICQYNNKNDHYTIRLKDYSHVIEVPEKELETVMKIILDNDYNEYIEFWKNYQKGDFGACI